MPEMITVGSEEDEFDHVINLRVAFDGAENIVELKGKLSEMDDYLDSLTTRGLKMSAPVDGGWVPIVTV